MNSLLHFYLTQNSDWDESEVWSHVSPVALPSAEPPADESDCPSVYLPALPPGCLTCWSHVDACWRPHPADGLTPLTALPRWQPHPADGLTPICCCCRSSGGELGSAWVAGQHTGPPWLAPVILPSHSSATDINNNSTSGFTLLSRVNPFHCSTDCCCCCCSGWPGPAQPPPPNSSPIPLAVSLHFSVSSTAALFPFSAHLKNFSHRLVFCVDKSE